MVKHCLNADFSNHLLCLKNSVRNVKQICAKVVSLGIDENSDANDANVKIIWFIKLAMLQH